MEIKEKSFLFVIYSFVAIALLLLINMITLTGTGKSLVTHIFYSRVNEKSTDQILETDSRDLSDPDAQIILHDQGDPKDYTIKVSDQTTLHVTNPNPGSGPSDSEEKILQRLSPEAQAFYKRSLQVRHGYPEDNGYRNFKSAFLMDYNGYITIKPQSGYTPNPDLYSDIPSSIPAQFYRYVKDCTTDITIERQVIDTTAGYSNYIGENRKQQQCVEDGSPDTYYFESSTKLE
jgi:hypothetical protein